MKIVIIHPFDPLGKKIGGAEIFIKGFIANLPVGWNVLLIGISSENRHCIGKISRIAIDSKDIEFCPILFIKEENRKSFIPLSFLFTLALRKFQSLISDNDLIVFNRIEPAVLFGRKSAKKVVIIHNDIEQQIVKSRSEVLWSRFPWMYALMENYIFNYIDYVYTVSSATRQFYVNKYSRIAKKIEFLPTWVDSKFFKVGLEGKGEFKEKVSLRYNIKEGVDDQWILFVGRMQVQKDPIRVFESFSQLASMNANVRLVMIGDGDLYELLQSRIKQSSVRDRVTLIKGLPHQELPLFYNASDLLILCSNFEGMPITLLEALQCGLPVVTTDVGEVKRIVRPGYSGEIAEDFKPENIARAMQVVLNNRAAYSIENCVSSVVDFTPDRVLKPVYGKMQELMEE